MASKGKLFAPPKDWKVLYDAVKEMRKSGAAPVDTIGCDRLYDPLATRSNQRYQILLSLMLSSQTRDQVTAAAMDRLKALKGGCIPKTINDLQEQKLAELLHPVSFYNNKAKFIKKTTLEIIERFDSEVPSEYDTLVSFPGLGPKMVHLFLQAADGVTLGIGVDVHVHRISQRFNWVPKTVKTPEDTRKALESWLPREYWNQVNHLLVGHGQTICLPRGPRCGDCAAAAHCPNAFKESKRPRDIEDAGLEAMLPSSRRSNSSRVKK
ncbi:endonuclease III, putative [Bodo saltans]|uniref:Endonuclease III homolog n=1 Tax=Bodo saltans TaxID=75058 RepID=A0A0S4JYX2_BODSA|nr:endonuclease III, putative [Bodo saltans]|eukprot:CUG93791.1 endonuclease III, putative [Bodo saltans]